MAPDKILWGNHAPGKLDLTSCAAPLEHFEPMKTRGAGGRLRCWRVVSLGAVISNRWLRRQVAKSFLCCCSAHFIRTLNEQGRLLRVE